MTRGRELKSPSLGAHSEVLSSLASRQKEEKKNVSFEPMDKAIPLNVT